MRVSAGGDSGLRPMFRLSDEAIGLLHFALC